MDGRRKLVGSRQAQTGASMKKRTLGTTGENRFVGEGSLGTPPRALDTWPVGTGEKSASR